jgi:hypothetical protein
MTAPLKSELWLAMEAECGDSFIERSDWLMAHRTRDEKVAWNRKWEALGLVDPEPRRPKTTSTRSTDHAVRPIVCIRCGVERLVRVGHPSPLCADCRLVLSKEEIALWTGKKAA